MVDIRSLAPRTDLVRPLSWQVAAGLQQVDGHRARQEVLASYLGGGAGLTWQWQPGLLAFTLLTGRLEHSRVQSPWISPGIGLDSGLLWRNAAGSALLEFEGNYFADGGLRHKVSLAQQVELGRNLGLRLSARRAFSRTAGSHAELELALRWYLFEE